MLEPLAGTVPLIHFGVGTGELLAAMRSAGADVVGVDWRVPLDEAARRLGPGAVVQGNLDPALLGAQWPVIERAVRRIVEQGRSATGHVFQPRPRCAAERRPGRADAHRGARPLPRTLRARLVVVGAGISGLTAARAAALAGYDVLVLEGAPRIGGKLQTAEVGGVRVDVGAEALLTVRPEGIELLAELGLDGERIAPSTTAARVRAGGRSHPLPAGTMMGIPTDVAAARDSGVLSAEALAAIEAEPKRAPLPASDDDVAVGALVRARLGDEIADRLVEAAARRGVLRARRRPLAAGDGAEAGRTARRRRLAGAGGPRGHRGRDARAGRGADLHEPPWRAGPLPDVLATTDGVTVRTSVTVRSVARTPTGFVLDCGAVPQAERIEADAVVLAVPAAKASRLLRGLAPAAAAELAGIESASLAIVTLAFDGVAPPPGSGLLVGAGERMAVKALTLSSQKWPIAPPGRTLLRASVGRAGELHALRLPDGELVGLVRRELRALTGISAAPVDALVTRWGGGQPQYAVGHVTRIARVRAAVAGVPGLAVCGAAFDGVGVPACIASARAAVARIVETVPARGR